MDVVIVGGGVCGLATALLLARDGHDITVLERDADALADSPQSAWDSWGRKGVPHFRQPHNLMPGFRAVLESELPDVQDALHAAGAVRFDLVNPVPAFFADRTPRAIDDKLWTLTARRPVLEWVVANAAENQVGVTVRRGVKVAELISEATATHAVPHVVGVRTETGEEIRADLVVDAMGRQSPGARWLRALGARSPYEEQADCGFTYYTRYFAGKEPERDGRSLVAMGTFSLLTLPGDNGTWSVTLFTASGDQPLKNLRYDDKWSNVVRACPQHAHWLDGEPLTGVLPMSGIVDRYRRFVVDDEPVATGFVAVADAWACTNPSAGRGLTVGMLHALQLRETLREAPDDPDSLVRVFDRRTEQHVAPWYDAQVAVDRARFAQMEALREDRQPTPPESPLARSILVFLSSLGASPDLYRAVLEYVGTLTPVQEILQRSEIVAALGNAAAASKDKPPPATPGPTRQQLLELVR